jgi:hypothetical protein
MMVILKEVIKVRRLIGYLVVAALASVGMWMISEASLVLTLTRPFVEGR